MTDQCVAVKNSVAARRTSTEEASMQLVAVEGIWIMKGVWKRRAVKAKGKNARAAVAMVFMVCERRDGLGSFVFDLT